MAEQARAKVRFSRLGAQSQHPVIAQLMERALANPDLLSLAAGFTDNALLPTPLIAETVKALSADEVDPEWLQYGTSAGRPGLREAVLEWLRRSPGEALPERTPEDVLITNGSQQALYLAVQSLCDPGDAFLVEQPSYFVFLELLQGLGVEPVGLPVDLDEAHDFLRRLNRLGHRVRVKGLYLQGYYANPTGLCMDASRKAALADIFAQEGWHIPVVEDGAYRDLFFHAPYPASSVLSDAAWTDFPCLYLGTLTKPLATGLKTGYAVSNHNQWLEKLRNAKGHQDFGTANANQAIVEHILRHDYYAPHLEAIRPRYARKCQRLLDALERGGLRELGWRWEAPEGGLLVWLEGPTHLATGPESDFCAACLEAGVLYVPGALCFATGEPDHCLRLSFGAIAEDRIEEAVTRLCHVAAAFA
ncbi:MAG: PLP-dependent aminotransferase family protein [Opitutales bacterium]